MLIFPHLFIWFPQNRNFDFIGFVIVGFFSLIQCTIDTSMHVERKFPTHVDVCGITEFAEICQNVHRKTPLAELFTK